MSQNNIILPSLEQDPDNLLRMLVLVGIVAMLLILSCTGYGIHRQSINDVLREAENDAARIGKVIVQENNDVLFRKTEQITVFDKNEISRFDKSIRKFLHPFGIVKIKLFDRDRLIIFSTDTKLIGQKVENNPRLELALQVIQAVSIPSFLASFTAPIT